MKKIVIIIASMISASVGVRAEEKAESEKKRLEILESSFKSYILAISIIDQDYRDERNHGPESERSEKVNFDIFRREAISYSFYIFRSLGGKIEKSLGIAMARLTINMSHDQIVESLKTSVGSMVNLNHGSDEFGSVYRGDDLDNAFQEFTKHVIEVRSTILPKNKQ